LILSVIVWFSQDLMQVLTMGFMLVPEFFLLMLSYGVVTGSLRPGRISAWMWFGLAGGTLWDLRWAASPGISGLINAIAVTAVYTAWNRTPLAGRSALLFAVLAGAAHFLSGIAHYFVWATPSEGAVRMFLLQQLLGVPILLLLCMIYAFRKASAHV
jgi:hypothetical protein